MDFSKKISTTIISLGISIAFLTGFSTVVTAQNSLSNPQPIYQRQTIIPFDGDEREQFLSFNGAGNISITLDIKANSTNGGVYVDFLNRQGKSFAFSEVIQAIHGGTDRIVKTISLGKSSQTVILKLKSISYGSSVSSAGTLKITLAGNVKGLTEDNRTAGEYASDSNVEFDSVVETEPNENSLDNPRLLRASSTVMNFEGKNEEYFLGFTGRGKVEITYDVRARGANAGTYITVLDKNGRIIAGQEVVQATNKGTARITQTVELNRTQLVIIKIVGIGYSGNLGYNPGTLKITFNRGFLGDFYEPSQK